MFGQLLIQTEHVCKGRCHHFSFLCCASSKCKVFAGNVLGLLKVVGSPANFLNTVGVLSQPHFGQV
jgi:hypothetical protein